DPLGRTLSVWVGTNDTGANDDNPAGSGPNNMVQISANNYPDNCECTQPSETRLLVDFTSGNDRVIAYGLDYRNRLGTITAPEHAFENRSYDNLDQVVQVDRYVDNGSGDPTWTIKTYFDAQGRVYKIEQNGYDPDNSNAPTETLTALNWYDESGNRI